MTAVSHPSPAHTRLQEYTDTSAVLMAGTLQEVYKLQEAAREGGALALEAMLGVPIIVGTPELDRVTHTTAAAFSFAARTGAETLAQAGKIDERTLAQVERERHPTVTNGLGSIAIMGKVRRVIPPAFSRRHEGQEPTGPEHVAIARNSFAVPRKLANQHFPVMVAIIRYLHDGIVMRGNQFSPDRFTIAESNQGHALAFADPIELARVIKEEKERLSTGSSPLTGKGQCPALRINLTEAVWTLMADIQEAELAVRPRDRLRHVGISAMKRLGLRVGTAA